MDEITRESLLNLYYILSVFLGIDAGERCKKNKIPFTQIFDLENNTPYGLTDDEANMLRTYIGIYNEGKPQNLLFVSKIYKERYTVTVYIITEILRKIYSHPDLISERNFLLKEGYKSKKLQGIILNLDLEVLDISEQFTQELKSFNINTIKDLIAINLETMKTITEKLYLEVFPIHIIECIHSIGLNFDENIETEILQYKQEQEKRMQKIYKKQQKYIDNIN